MKNTLTFSFAAVILIFTSLSQASTLTAVETVRCQSNGKYIGQSLNAYWANRVSRVEMNKYLTNALIVVLEETTSMGDADIRILVEGQVALLGTVIGHYNREGLDKFKTDTERLAAVAKIEAKVLNGCFKELLRYK